MLSRKRNRLYVLITLVLMMAAVMVPAGLAAGAPVLLSGEITNKGDYSLTFDQAIANLAGTQGQFTVTADGKAVKVMAVETTNTVGKIKLSLETKVAAGQAMVVQYTKSNDTALQLKSTDGVAVESFSYGLADEPQPAVPPTINADSSTNQVGQAIELTFASTPDWSSKITNVKVDDVSVRGKYTVSDGKIVIAAEVFTAAKDYAIVVKATGYDDAVLTQAVDAKPADEPGPVPPAIELKDIKGHWAQGNIEALVAKGAVSGNPDGTFLPEKKISRAEFASMLVNAFKLQPGQGKVFADTENHWARAAISTAFANGIIGGYSDTRFGPDDTITREQMAVMIIKAAQAEAGTGTANFSDSTAISVWAAPYVAAAVENKYMSGYPGNLFAPLQGASRAEAVTVIFNALPK
ncbi:MAG: S-layer homology domain-containing protein [Syntrophomonadaceae bacterium]